MRLELERAEQFYNVGEINSPVQKYFIASQRSSNCQQTQDVWNLSIEMAKPNYYSSFSISRILFGSIWNKKGLSLLPREQLLFF